MAEPISPEAYLALAATVNNAVNSYRGKRTPDEQSDSTTNVSAAAGAKAPAALPTDELLSYAGLKIGNDGYVQLVAESPAHPRNWSRRRKAYDFGLILFSEFFMNGVGAAGTPASSDDGVKVLGHWSREVRLVAFTTMYVMGYCCVLLSVERPPIGLVFVQAHTPGGKKGKKLTVNYQNFQVPARPGFVRVAALAVL